MGRHGFARFVDRHARKLAVDVRRGCSQAPAIIHVSDIIVSYFNFNGLKFPVRPTAL